MNVLAANALDRFGDTYPRTIDDLAHGGSKLRREVPEMGIK